MKSEKGNVRSPRPRIGDVVEIRTAKGLAYALYSHEHDQESHMGSLLRVLPNLFSKRPENFKEVANGIEQFAVFFPLRAAVKQGIVHIVGHEELPDWAIPFPVFRNGLPDTTGRIRDWWLWDGERERRVGELKQELRSYPVLRVVNDTALIEMIENGYKPESDI